MEDLVIYEKPTCSKCRAADALLDASGRPYRKVRYMEKPLSEKKLGELLKKLGIPARELVRTNENEYKALKVNAKEMSDREIVSLLAKHPALLERPILECGDRAVLGRPTENVARFLKEIAK